MLSSKVALEMKTKTANKKLETSLKQSKDEISQSKNLHKEAQAKLTQLE